MRERADIGDDFLDSFLDHQAIHVTPLLLAAWASVVSHAAADAPSAISEVPLSNFPISMERVAEAALEQLRGFDRRRLGRLVLAVALGSERNASRSLIDAAVDFFPLNRSSSSSSSSVLNEFPAWRLLQCWEPWQPPKADSVPVDVILDVLCALAVSQAASVPDVEERATWKQMKDIQRQMRVTKRQREWICDAAFELASRWMGQRAPRVRDDGDDVDLEERVTLAAYAEDDVTEGAGSKADDVDNGPSATGFDLSVSGLLGAASRRPTRKRAALGFPRSLLTWMDGGDQGPSSADRIRNDIPAVARPGLTSLSSSHFSAELQGVADGLWALARLLGGASRSRSLELQRSIILRERLTAKEAAEAAELFLLSTLPSHEADLRGLPGCSSCVAGILPCMVTLGHGPSQALLDLVADVVERNLLDSESRYAAAAEWKGRKRKVLMRSLGEPL